MEIHKPYRDSSLTLTGLSKQLSITMCYLSQIVNESFNQNFNDFINSYRIKESQYLLLDHSNGKMTVLEIAYKVGFNSKSAFNTAFKKHTDLYIGSIFLFFFATSVNIKSTFIMICGGSS